MLLSKKEIHKWLREFQPWETPFTSADEAKIRQHAHIITSWSYVSQLPVSEKFIEDYAHKIGWYYVSGRDDLSESFILKYFDRITFQELAMHRDGRKYSRKLVRLIEDRFPQFKKVVDPLSVNVIRFHIQADGTVGHTQSYRIDREYESKKAQEFLTKWKQPPSAEMMGVVDTAIAAVAVTGEYSRRSFLLGAAALLGKTLVDNAPVITELAKERTNWEAISYEYNLPEAFIEEFHEKLNWDGICHRSTLSQAFIEKWKHKVVGYSLSRNKEFKKLPTEFKNQLLLEGII